MQVEFNGKMLEVTSVPFRPFSEPWAEYHLEDGSVLRFRSTVTQVVRAVTEKNADGSPLYITYSSNQMVVNPKE